MLILTSNGMRWHDACMFGLDECALPRASGTCKERLPRWYFDASENRCSPFYYTGCQGNGNNFDTREVCEAACPPKIGKLWWYRFVLRECFGNSTNVWIWFLLIWNVFVDILKSVVRKRLGCISTMKII